jgi:hypothetical protein
MDAFIGYAERIVTIMNTYIITCQFLSSKDAILLNKIATA